MMEIELFDPDENQSYKLYVTQENHNSIMAGDLELARTLLQNHIAEKENEAGELTENKDPNSNSGKLWTTSSTILLIELLKKYNKELDEGMKKNLMTKISEEMSVTLSQKFSPQQVDTKFKVLKNMYKKVKVHNEKSGNNKKNWEYYDLMHELMYCKPEITARATCSSIAGLNVIRSPNTGTSGNENIIMTSDKGDDGAGASSQFVSSFTTKRKHFENQINKRHREKMQRQDRYLDLLERLTAAVEKNAGNT